MSLVENAMANYQGLIEKAGLDAGDQDWRKDIRKQGSSIFNKTGLPHRKLEQWRYTQLDGLFKHELTSAAEGSEIVENVNLDEFSISGMDTHRLVCVNGRFMPQLSDIESFPAGMSVSWTGDTQDSEPDWLKSGIGKVSHSDNEPFAALNSALFDGGLFLHIAQGAKIERPIEIMHITTGFDRASAAFPRAYVVLSTDAEAVLIERFIGASQAFYLNNGLNEIRLEKNAKLEHYRVIEESAASYHMWNNYVQNGSHSSYTCVDYVLGGAWSRTEQHMRFTEPGAHCELSGLYVVGSNQFSDFHMDVCHNIAGCSSNEYYKGIVFGNGRAVFDANIYVAKHAQKTDAHLKNSNLMLSKDAEVDTKPQLKIFADDVKCSHGATVGQLDYNQMYYLRSRGIPEEQARNMLCLSFVSEILDFCKLEGLQNYIRDRIESELPRLTNSQVTP